MLIQRDIFKKTQKYLSTPEILLLVGARQTGKTTLLKELQKGLSEQGKETFFLTLEDPQYLSMLNESPKKLLEIFPFDLTKTSYIFLDEIQYLQNPAHFLKYLYDEYQGKLKLIVSGSSAFYIDEKFTDSLAGRKKIFPVSTITFSEFFRFQYGEKIADKLWGELSLSEKEKSDACLREYLLYGGYPRVILAPMEEKKDILRELAFSYIKKDVFDAGIRNEDVFYHLFRILASQIGNLMNVNELSTTLRTSRQGIERYIHTMQKSFHISLVRPFFENLRKELTKMPKVYFHDLGLRNFFVNDFSPFLNREDKGALLENFAFLQFMKKYDEANIHFWRTQNGNEVDFVIENDAYEVKANEKNFEKQKYKIFLETYKEKELRVLTFSTGYEQQNKENTVSVTDVRELV